ncbi:MAG: hypothetical protein Q9219_003101 [cf. Caloplaca sp. 3 TL-2023]
MVPVDLIRFGIIAASQLPLHYLLAFKSSYSPISYLTRLSHEELNPYHRALGRILLLFLSLHASFYLNFYVQKSLLLKRIQDKDVILGLLAITAFLILGTTALARIRRRSYFLFFTLHVILSISLLPILYFHVSHLRVYILESAAVYILLILQRNISQTKVASAVLSPIQGTSNLISVSIPFNPSSLRKDFHPGQHIYLSLPTPLTSPQEKLRLNPFTVANLPHKDSHVRLVLRSLNGTTNILSNLAHKPAHNTTLLLEGPYGAATNFPNFLEFEQVLLVAGGVGATFTIPIYRDLMHRGFDPRRIKFIWAVRRMEDAGWAMEYLGKGCQIYCTGGDDHFIPQQRSNQTRNIPSAKDDDDNNEETAIELQERAGLMTDIPDDTGRPLNSPIPPPPPPHITIHNHTRPNFSLIINELFAPSRRETSYPPPLSTKTAVLVCGPAGMAAALRREFGPWVKRGREVWWHNEDFGW